MYAKTYKKKKSKHVSNKRITDFIPCEICHERRATETHELKGGGWRNTSIKYGFQLKLCSLCHFNFHTKLTKEECDYYREAKQREIMSNGMTEDEWLNIFKKSWLGVTKK